MPTRQPRHHPASSEGSGHRPVGRNLRPQHARNHRQSRASGGRFEGCLTALSHKPWRFNVEFGFPYP